MKRMKWLVWITGVGVGAMTAQLSAQEASGLKTQKEQLSYAIGVDMARNLKRQGIEVDMGVVVKGLNDGISGEKLLVSERDLHQLLVKAQNEVRQKQAPIRGKTVAELNMRKGEAFLAGNKTKPGVAALPSGLQYQILKAGNGAKPSPDNTVQCFYRGTLLDGTEIMCSEAGKPGIFKVKEAIIPGWTEALRLMPLGSKWRLFIPPPLAYGASGLGKDVGPNETLIFDLELVTIQ